MTDPDYSTLTIYRGGWYVSNVLFKCNIYSITQVEIVSNKTLNS